MPQVIDYVGRFEQIREAVYEVTLQQGAAAITLDSVASQMGVSRSTLCRLLAEASALPWLGRELVDRRERTRRVLHYPQRRDGEPQWRTFLDQLCWVLPFDDLRADEARVRLRLTQVFGDRDSRLLEADATRAEMLDELVRCLVDSCAVAPGDTAACVAHLWALVDGLVHRVCAGRLEPGEGRSLLEAHVAGMAQGGGRRVA